MEGSVSILSASSDVVVRNVNSVGPTQGETPYDRRMLFYLIEPRVTMLIFLNLNRAGEIDNFNERKKGVQQQQTKRAVSTLWTEIIYPFIPYKTID